MDKMMLELLCIFKECITKATYHQFALVKLYQNSNYLYFKKLRKGCRRKFFPGKVRGLDRAQPSPFLGNKIGGGVGQALPYV